MIEATFGDCHGQAFTDMPGQFKASIGDVLNFKLADNFERAVFIATINAVMRRMGYTSSSRHCRNTGPRECAKQLPSFVREHFGNPRIAFIGYQPAMIEELSSSFRMRVVDLDPDNIGMERFGVIVEASERTEEILSWCDLILATGSTSVNGTITGFLGKKPVVFYGVTVAGITAMKGYRHYCPYSE